MLSVAMETISVRQHPSAKAPAACAWAPATAPPGGQDIFASHSSEASSPPRPPKSNRNAPERGIATNPVHAMARSNSAVEASTCGGVTVTHPHDRPSAPGTGIQPALPTPLSTLNHDATTTFIWPVCESAARVNAADIGGALAVHSSPNTPHSEGISEVAAVHHAVHEIHVPCAVIIVDV